VSESTRKMFGSDRGGQYNKRAAASASNTCAALTQFAEKERNHVR
jgi:hypothetical protein